MLPSAWAITIEMTITPTLGAVERRAGREASEDHRGGAGSRLIGDVPDRTMAV